MGFGQNETSFNSNPYQNPQMGQYGGSNMVNTNSPMHQWQMQQSPQGQQYNEFFDPNNPGMDSYYNPYTQNTVQNYQPGSGIAGNSNAPFANALSWTDAQGNKFVDPSQLSGLMGGGAGGGYQNYGMTDFQGGQMEAPAGYGGGDWDVAKNVVNVHDVIESYRPTMEAEIGAGFSNAGNRLGQSGFAMSTPYAQKLGEVEALARAKMNQRGLEFQYDAGKFDAGNQMQAMMAENAEKFGGWQQAGNWDMQAQAGNMGSDLQQWMLQNQYGFADNQGQNQWNQQNQMQQQQMLAALLGGLL